MNPNSAVPAEAIDSRLRPGWSWWLLAVLATAIAGYGLALQDGRPARDTVPGLPWLDEVHFAAGGVALGVGIWCFRRDVLARATRWHRWLGRVYVLAVCAAGSAGLAMAVFSGGGIAAHLGFAGLAVAWLGTTCLGWVRIRRREIAAHRRCMVRSYAVCFAAVTLRLELPVLVWLSGSYATALQLVSWLCWVPNLLVAEGWLRRTTTAGRWREGFGQRPPGATARA